MGATGRRQVCVDGAHGDDRAGALLPHHRQDGPSAELRAGQVDPQHQVPLLEIDLQQLLSLQRGVDGGAGHQNIDAAEAFQRLAGHRLSRGLVGDVDGEGQALLARPRQLGSEPLRRFLIDVRDDDARSFVRQPQRERPADAVRAAGNDRHLVL